MRVASNDLETLANVAFKTAGGAGAVATWLVAKLLGTLRVALWRRLLSLPRRLSSRRLEREPLPQPVSARVPRWQSKRLRHEQPAQCRLKRR